MKGQKLKNAIHNHIKMKRSLSNTAPFPGNWLHSKQTGFNQFFAHRMDKRAAEESISDPKNTTDQKVFSFHLKKDECVEVKTIKYLTRPVLVSQWDNAFTFLCAPHCRALFLTTFYGLYFFLHFLLVTQLTKLFFS